MIDAIGLIRRQVNYYQNTFGLGYFRFTQSELIDLENLLSSDEKSELRRADLRETVNDER